MDAGAGCDSVTSEGAGSQRWPTCRPLTWGVRITLCALGSALGQPEDQTDAFCQPSALEGLGGSQLV